MIPSGALSIDHIGVVVRDLDGAAAEWQRRFGAQVLGTESLDHLGIEVTYLGVEGQSMVQLLKPRHGPLADYLAEHGEGLHHICYAVEDIAEAAARLAGGAAVNIVRGGRGRLACFLPERVNNVIIELTEVRPSF